MIIQNKTFPIFAMFMPESADYKQQNYISALFFMILPGSILRSEVESGAGNTCVAGYQVRSSNGDNCPKGSTQHPPPCSRGSAVIQAGSVISSPSGEMIYGAGDSQRSLGDRAGCAIRGVRDAILIRIPNQPTFAKHLPQNLLESFLASFRGLRLANVPGCPKIYIQGYPKYLQSLSQKRGSFVKSICRLF